MKTITINVPFTNEDVLYTTKQTKVEKDCHICEGTGRIKYNDKDMKCPECNGIGKFMSAKAINIVCEEPYKIITTKVTITSCDNLIVTYKGSCGFIRLNRASDNLFLTREEAQIRCNELNREKTFVRLDDIVIQDSFKETYPSIDKIQEKLGYYKVNNKFKNYITVDKDNVLQDGYINYLVYKLMGNNLVKVVTV